MTSFNAFGSGSKNYSQTSKPVWLGTVAPHVVGGVLASAYRIAGAHYPAGTPVNLTAGVIKPLVFFEVTAFSAGDGTTTTVDTITVKPAQVGGANVLPAVGDFIQKLGSTFAATGKAAEVASVAENVTTAGTYDITVSHAATIDEPNEGDLIVLSSAAAAGSSKTIAVQPNGYLYSDIYLGGLSNPNATGAVVDFHGEGLLVDFTPAAAVAALMKAAVPNVIQHTFPDDAFATID